MPSPLLPLPFSHSSSEINSTRREREDEGLMGHIFGPAVMLVLWNLVVEVWMYSRLIPTIEGANIKVGEGRGERGEKREDRTERKRKEGKKRRVQEDKVITLLHRLNLRITQKSSNQSSLRM